MRLPLTPAPCGLGFRVSFLGVEGATHVGGVCARVVVRGKVNVLVAVRGKVSVLAVRAEEDVQVVQVVQVMQGVGNVRKVQGMMGVPMQVV